VATLDAFTLTFHSSFNDEFEGIIEKLQFSNEHFHLRREKIDRKPNSDLLHRLSEKYMSSSKKVKIPDKK
jgi:hypothetical protein